MEGKIRELFNKYVEGTATAKERQVVEAFFEKMQEGGITPGSVAENRLLMERLDEKVYQKTIYRRRTSKRMWLAAAASLLVIASVAITLYVVNFKEEMLTVVAQNGKRLRVILPDSSVAYLNSGSTLTYPSRMRQRTLKLSGEAYFEVTHNPSKPFIVESGSLITRVLGTQFVVSDYAGEEPAVIVRSGKVGVQTPGNNPLAILEKNQRVSYSHGSPVVESVRAEDYYSWKDGNIVFDGANLNQVISTLNRRFNVSIVLTSRFDEKCTITGSYPDRSIDDVLKSLQFIYGIEYSTGANGTIKLKAKPC
jgi:transmembrane sensor